MSVSSPATAGNGSYLQSLGQAIDKAKQSGDTSGVDALVPDENTRKQVYEQHGITASQPEQPPEPTPAGPAPEQHAAAQNDQVYFQELGRAIDGRDHDTLKALVPDEALRQKVYEQHNIPAPGSETYLEALGKGINEAAVTGDIRVLNNLIPDGMLREKVFNEQVKPLENAFLRFIAGNEFGIDVVGDVKSENIRKTIDAVDNLPPELLNVLKQSGSRIELNQGDLSEYGGTLGADGNDVGNIAGFAEPGLENSRAVIAENGIADAGTHGSVDLVLHELGHVFDTLGGNDNAYFEHSDGAAFQHVYNSPEVRDFINGKLGEGSYHAGATTENFAELFAFYYAGETQRSELPVAAQAYFSRLRFVA